MGAHPYWYFVPYEADAGQALEKLRQREFTAGRYNPVIAFLPFPLAANAPAPGAQHDSIEEAQEDAAEDGTRSILDILAVADEPDFCVAAPVPDEVLQELLGSAQPTHQAMEEGFDGLIEELERGHAIVVTIYKNGKPDELFFAGYSFD